MSNIPPPWYYGVKSRGLVYDGGKIEMPSMPIALASNLDELDFFQFFSAGLLYAYGYMSDVLLADFYISHGYTPVFEATFTDAVWDFHHTVSKWNNVLWAVSKAAYPMFSDFLCSTMLKHPKVGMLAYAEQAVTIPDPLELQNRTANRDTATRVEVPVFGVRAQTCMAYMDTGCVPPKAKLAKHRNVDLSVFMAGLNTNVNPWDLVQHYEQESTRVGDTVGQASEGRA